MGEDNLGKLIVSIGTDLTELSKGLTDATKQVNDTAKKIAETTTKISTGMVAAGGAIVGAFSLMVKSSVQYGEEIYRASEKTGIATETLSRLRFVADQADVSFESVSNGLKFLQRSMYEANLGSTKYAEAFRTLGVSVKDVHGNLKDVDAVLLEIADVFAKSEDATAKTAIAMQIFGRAGTQLIPVLNMGSLGIKELSATADKLGVTLTRQNAAELAQYYDNWEQLKTAMGGIQLAIAQNVLPAFTNFINRAKDAIAKVKEWSDANKELSKNLSNAALNIGGVLLAIGTLGLALVGISKVVTALWTGFNAIVPLATTFSLIKMGMLATDIGIVASACGIMQTSIPIIGAALAGWSIGNLIGQIKSVQGFFDWVTGADKAKAFEAQATKDNQVAVSAKQAAYPTEMSIDVTKSRSQLQDPLAEAERQKAIQQEYQDWYAQMQRGLVMIDQNASTEKLALMQQETNEKISLVQTYNQAWQTAHRSMYALANTLVNTLQNGLQTALSGIIMGTLTARDAFKMLGQAMVKAVVDYMVQQAIAWVISRALAATATATTAMMAASLAMAWAPAATLASIATFGGAAAAGTAAMATGLMSSMAMVAGVSSAASSTAASGFAEGTDTIPAMLSPGEMVIPRSFSDAIRAGDLSLSGAKAGGQSTNNSNMHIEIYQNNIINNEMDIKKAAEQLALETSRELRYIR